MAMNDREAQATFGRSAVPGAIAGFFVSLLLIGVYVTVEGLYIQPRQEAAQLERRDERVRQAIEANVGQDQFWKATVWDVPSRERQFAILVLLCLPAFAGAMIAAWLARRRVVLSACGVVIAYLIVVPFPPPLATDDGPGYPMSEIVTLPGLVTLGVLTCFLLVLPIVGVAAIQSFRSRSARRYSRSS